MPNHYARATALSNVGGRLNYISSPERQEHLLAFYDGAADQLDGQFWRQLSRECQDAFDQFGEKTRMVKDRTTGELKERQLKCCEGREIMQPLSNALLERMKPDEIARTIAKEFKEKLDLTVAVGVHFNKKENNLHAHIIFPERQLLQEPVGQKVAERNLFFDETGKRRYKKAEILDENKQLRPGCRIVQKGELYGDVRHFGPVDQKYSRKGWLEDTKNNVLLPLINGKLQGDVEITKYDPASGKLPQQHIGPDIEEGNPAVAARIEQYNKFVKVWNNTLDRVRFKPSYIQGLQEQVMKAPKKNAAIMEAFQKIKTVMEKRLKRQEEAKAARERPVSSQLDQDAPTITTPGTTPSAPERPKVAPAPAAPEFTLSFDARSALAAALSRLQTAQFMYDVKKKARGEVRPINYELIRVPETLRSTLKEMRSALEKKEAAVLQLRRNPMPSAPGPLASKKKKEQYAVDLAAYDKAWDAKASAQRTLATGLDVIRPYLSQQNRIKQGYGYDAPEITADNMTAADLNHIERTINFGLQKGRGIEYPSAREAEYRDKVEAFKAAEKELDAAQTAFDAIMEEIPAEHRQDAQKQAEDVLSAQRRLKMDAEFEKQEQKQRAKEKQGHGHDDR